MSLRVYCPDCNMPRTVPRDRENRRVRCRRCDRIFRPGVQNRRGDRPERAPDIDPMHHRTMVWVVVTVLVLISTMVAAGGMAAWYVLASRPVGNCEPEWNDPNADFRGPPDDLD